MQKVWTKRLHNKFTGKTGTTYMYDDILMTHVYYIHCQEIWQAIAVFVFNNYVVYSTKYMTDISHLKSKLAAIAIFTQYVL